jgi:acyl-CoA thioesterase-1
MKPLADFARSHPLLFLVFVVLLGLGWNWYRSNHWAITHRLPSNNRIAMLGDSLTSGVGASPGRTWPELIGEKLGVEVIAAGVAGDTSRGGLARLQNQVLDADPGIVIVCLGGNDILQRIPVEDTLRNLEQIIQQCQDRGILVVLVGINGLPLMSSHNKNMRELARRYGTIFVPNILSGLIGNRRYMTDTVHPNSAGYEIMAQRVVDRLRPHLAF